MKRAKAKYGSLWRWFNVQGNFDRFLFLPYKFKLFNIALHKLAPDERGPLHDHPHSFLSIRLWGGPIKETFQRTPTSRRIVRELGRFVWRDAKWFHRIESIGKTPCYTLVFRGPNTNRWGMLVEVENATDSCGYGYDYVKMAYQDYKAREGLSPEEGSTSG